MRHDAAYWLGELKELGDQQTMRLLVESVLNDPSALVRHEAAMALDNIGDESVLLDLGKGLLDPSSSVVVSCRLAIIGILHRTEREWLVYNQNNA